ncbi:MAG: DNA translocase FtsK 4TM domain-containing protein [Acidobacteriota bacterium]|nr:DNA translocase FtsK 4TM domain-containing protein [Acidobacteriota bacterium]
MSFPPFTRAIERRMYVIGILLVPVAFFVLLSLATHAETDYPNSSRGPGEVTNLGGLPGALVSYGVMLALGYGGYVVPVLIGLLAWNRIRGQHPVRLFVQSAWLLVLVVAGISTGSLIPVLPEYLRFRIGGVLGYYLGGRMAGALGVDWSLILGGVLFLVVLVAMLYFCLIRRRAIGRRSHQPGSMPS